MVHFNTIFFCCTTRCIILSDQLILFLFHFPAPLEIQRHFWFEKNQFYVIVLTSALEKGHQYKIKMKFRAELGDGLAGLYKSTYTREDGTEVYVNFINPFTFFKNF